MLSSTPCGYVSSPAKSLIVCTPLASPFAFYVPWRLGPHFSFKDACFQRFVYSYEVKSCYSLFVTLTLYTIYCFQRSVYSYKVKSCYTLFVTLTLHTIY